MDFFFVEYRDPLVGLIFLGILIFVVALANYMWSFFASKDEEQKLENFIKKFELDNTHKDILKSKALSLENLIFLAEIFTKSGEFEKATQIYLISLDKTKDKNKQEMIFLSLAKVYFKAGFLAKSREVILNALKIRPRNKEALKLLKILYLQLKLYKENLELLECLFELGEDIKDESEFFKALIIQTQNLNPSQKQQELLKLDFKNNPSLKRWLYEQDMIFEEQELLNIIDLLYKNDGVVNINDENYKEFFCALGRIDEKLSFKNSSFRMFKILKDNHFKARFEFSYICKECKSVMPLFFYHCPVCYEFGKCFIVYEVKSDETG